MTAEPRPTNGLRIFKTLGEDEDFHSIASNSTVSSGSRLSITFPRSRQYPEPKSPSFDVVREIVARLSFPTLSKVWVFVLAVYSTIFSCFWFLVAAIKPHWGTFIANHGSISPTTASTLTAGFAKTIEMSFVTVFVACLGQYLTKAAKENGIRTSDFQLKTLMLLPGAFFTQKGIIPALWHRGMLGLCCIIACIAAVFYTTASDALVSPRPSLANPVHLQLMSSVRTSMANPYYISQNCPNPYGTNDTGDNCIITEHAGSAMHNYIMYLSKWQPSLNDTIPYNDPSHRPLPEGIVARDLPIHGRWMPTIDSADLTVQYGRVITSSMMAMPNAAVAGAASLDYNNLSKIVDQRDSGQLTIEASAVTPVVNVTCAVVTEKDLLPIIYSNWTRTTPVLLPNDFINMPKNASWRQNTTAFDDVFGFKSPGRDRPVFYKLPEISQTLLDGAGTFRDMLYILLKSHIQEPDEYTLCGMSLTLIGECSTVLSTNVTGSRLHLRCEPDNPLNFPGTPKLSSIPGDWVNTANEWAIALGLGGGTTNSVIALASMLTQLAPTDTAVNPRRPSLTEALAVLSINTLADSTIDAPLDGNWTHKAGEIPKNILPEPVLRSFQAKIQVSDYSSGTTNQWQNLFILILLAVFILNVVCLAYLIMLSCGRLSITKRDGVRRLPPKKMQRDITDFHEMFATAISSPQVDVNFDDEREHLLKGRHAKWSYSDGVFVPFDCEDGDSKSHGKVLLVRDSRRFSTEPSPTIPITFDFEHRHVSILGDEEKGFYEKF